MPKTRALVTEKGAFFSGMFASVPVCCPSRSSFLTGQYQHNHHVINNSLQGNCSGNGWQDVAERQTFPIALQSAGYVTSFGGKYLNMYGVGSRGGVGHVPPGWTDWQSLAGNSVYYNYTLSNNGVAETYGESYPGDYLPLVLANKTSAFIRKHAGTTPFFSMLSLPSCHEPADPAPEYSGLFPDAVAPRTPNYNASVNGSHWFEATQAVYGLTPPVARWVDLLYRRRLQTLQTVDDIVAGMLQLLDELGQLDTTYVIFTSDHGYHTGAFGMPMDKRQPFDMDTRMPLMVRGPGIAAGSVVDVPVSAVDIAPTILDMAGAEIPDTIDGSSIMPLLRGERGEGGDESSGAEHAGTVLIEYHGEGGGGGAVTWCPRTYTDNNLYCSAKSPQYPVPPSYVGVPVCVCEDAMNNTYSCLRTINGTHNFRYCEFSVGTVEYFDLSSDPWELYNAVATLAPTVKAKLSSALAVAVACAGADGCAAALSAQDGSMDLMGSDM